MMLKKQLRSIQNHQQSINVCQSINLFDKIKLYQLNNIYQGQDLFFLLIKMTCLLRNLLLLKLCLSLTFSIICPLGQLTLSSFPTLTGDNFSHSPKSFDAVYQIKRKSTGKYDLIGHRISQVQNGQNPFFDVKQFSTASSQQQKIIFVSDLGNCLIVRSRPSLKVFETSQNRFILSQNVPNNDYASTEVNEDCSLVRVKTKDGTQIVYKNSRSNIIIFPQKSQFDSFYIYGIDNSRQLRKVSGTRIDSISLANSALEDTPLLIENKKSLNTLIILTKDSQTQRHTLTIVNTLEDKVVYSNSWPSTNFTGDLLSEISNTGNFMLIRNTKGLLLLLKVSFNISTGLQVKEIELESLDYSEMFSNDTIVSFTDDAIICYQNKQMAYFQFLGKTLYYLTSLPADLEAETFRFSGLNFENKPLAATYIEPSFYQNCYASTFNLAEQSVKKLTEDGQVPVVIRANGSVLKCRPDCLSCNQDGICLLCALGYSLSSKGQCVFCFGCRKCFPDFPETCLSCFSPEVFNPTTKKCEPPKCTQPFCVSCHLNGTCNECFQGYSVFNGRCIKCQDGCPSCSIKGLDTCDVKVSVCKLGFIYSNHVSKGTDFSCVQCASGCLSCSKTDISNCTSCNNGFYGSLNPQTKVYRCLSCMENCRSCTTSNTCDRCLTGYMTNVAKTKCIERCDQQCLSCSNTNKTLCLSCYEGSFLENGQCQPDLSCNPTKKCSVCAYGYALLSGQCLGCRYTDPNCQGCSASALNVCLKCRLGFYMNLDHQCVKCQSACTGCQGSDSCFSCNAGFYLARIGQSVTGKCLQCESQCKTCNNFGYLCTSCVQGFILEGSKCISQNHLNYTMTVNSPLQMVIMVSRTFVQVLISFGQKYSVDQENPLRLTAKDVTLSDLKNGSSIVNGLMSTFSSRLTKAISERITEELVGTSLQSGYSIIGVSVMSVTPDIIDENDSQKQQQPSSLNIGLVLGLVIPLGLLVLLSIAIVICIAYKRRTAEQSDNLDTNEECFVDESHKQIRSNDDTQKL